MSVRTNLVLYDLYRNIYLCDLKCMHWDLKSGKFRCSVDCCMVFAEVPPAIFVDRYTAKESLKHACLKGSKVRIKNTTV